MTTAQTQKYFREWGEVRKACLANQWELPDRHELHRRALGRDRSSKDFTNADFDKVLQVFWSFSKPASVNAGVRQERMPRTRLEYKIVNEQAALLAVLHAFQHGQAVESPEQIPAESHAAAEHYIIELMVPRFGTDDITQISDQPMPGRTGEKSDLECLRDTLDARITELRHSTSWTWHELRIRAGTPCGCKTFCRSLRTATVKKEEGVMA